MEPIIICVMDQTLRVEEAKTIAVSCWVIEHSLCCAVDSQRRPCRIASCSRAKSALRALEANTGSPAASAAGSIGLRARRSNAARQNPDTSGESADAAAAAGQILDHRRACATARGAAGDGPPCLVCALVSRARCVAAPGGLGLRLDFSKRAEGDTPDFSAPAETLTRSATTEELARLLSGLHGSAPARCFKKARARRSLRGPLDG